MLSNVFVCVRACVGAVCTIDFLANRLRQLLTIYISFANDVNQYANLIDYQLLDILKCMHLIRD